MDAHVYYNVCHVHNIISVLLAANTKYSWGWMWFVLELFGHKPKLHKLCNLETSRHFQNNTVHYDSMS